MAKREFGMPFEPLEREVREFVDQQDKLVQTANKARERGIHHSGFQVGATAIVRKFDGRLVTLTGWNNKPNKGAGVKPRRCAEEHIIEQASPERSGSFQLIIGFVIVAPHQPDDFTGIDLGVLLPCGYCRKNLFQDLIAKGKLIVPTTRIVSVNAGDLTKRVKLTMEMLFKMCNGHSH